MAQGTRSKKSQTLLICGMLILLIVAAFEPIRHNDFVDYDDKTYVLLNTHIYPGFTMEGLKWAFTSGYASNWHPLTWLSHMIDIELFGLKPLGHHLHNVVLHTGAVLLLFMILKSMTGRVWSSAFAAAVFAIHPLRVESVAWAAERKDVLCAFFWMLTTAAYIGYARRGGFLRYLMVVLCFCLGLMAKPMIVTLPIVFFLLDIWPLGRLRILSLTDTALQITPPFGAASILRLIMEKIPLLILVVISCIVTYKIQYATGAVDALTISWTHRLENVFVSYIGYLQKIIWPAGLAVLYPFPEQGWPNWQVAAAITSLLVGSLIALLTIRRYPWLFVGWFWYIIVLIPVIGLVQIGTHALADRYSYLPSIGILILVTWLAGQFLSEWKYQKTCLALLGIAVICALIPVTRKQLSYWKDSFALNSRALAVTKNNYTVYNNMAVTLVDEGKYDQALVYLQKSLEIRPRYYMACANMANVLKELHRYDEALEYIKQAIQEMPYGGLAYFVQGRVLADMGNFDAALESYKTAARLDPDDFRFSYDAGLLLAKKGQMEEAIRYFKQCIRSNSTWGDAYRDMGLAYQRLGLIWDALASYRRALQLLPADYVTCFRTAYCFQQIGHPRDAVYFYGQAIKFKPDFPQALERLAWLKATSSLPEIWNPFDAARLAERAAQLSDPNDYRVLDTLAAAYAGQKRFKEAQEVLQKAIGLARTANDADSVEEFTARLELYRQEKFYIEPAVEQKEE